MLKKTIVKRISFCLTKESKNQLDYVCQRFAETPTKVINRAIQLLYHSCMSEMMELINNKDAKESKQ